MADHAMRTAFDALRPGISEVERAGSVARALGEAGSEYAAISPMAAAAAGVDGVLTVDMPPSYNFV